MYDVSDIEIYHKRLHIVIGDPEWCLIAQKMINSLINIILSIYFHLPGGGGAH